jgi:hypothetical protein
MGRSATEKNIYIYILYIQNKTSTVKRRGDGAFFRRGRGLNGSTATGNIKELRHSSMMVRDGKMGEKNVGQGRAGGQKTCWSHLFRMKTVAGRSLETSHP